MSGLSDSIIAAIRDSGDCAVATWRISRKLGITSRAARNELIKMESAGLVARVPHWSGANNIIWELRKSPTPPDPDHA